jgi:hypothetical protein
MNHQKALPGAMDASGMEIRQVIDAWLGRLEVGAEQPLGPLRMSPLIHHGPHEPPFVLLHEAIAANVLQIMEQGSGTVNEVVAHNTGDRPVLILEGESVVGAKQNRVVVEDVVLAPGSMVSVPVGCVERGRWRTESVAFMAAQMPVEPTIRCRNVAEASSGGRVDQGRLWRDVAAKLAGSSACSVTDDYHRYAESWHQDAHKQAGAIELVPGQVGMLVCFQDVLVGLDLLGHPDNWTSYSPRAVSSYALSGLSQDWKEFMMQVSPRTAGRPPKDWLGEVTKSRMLVRPAYGIGLQLRVEGDAVLGGGLWVTTRPAHLAVFARN